MIDIGLRPYRIKDDFWSLYLLKQNLQDDHQHPDAILWHDLLVPFLFITNRCWMSVYYTKYR